MVDTTKVPYRVDRDWLVRRLVNLGVQVNTWFTEECERDGAEHDDHAVHLAKISRAIEGIRMDADARKIVTPQIT